MGGKSIARKRKRKFVGNQFTNAKISDNAINTVSTASSEKLKISEQSIDISANKMTGNRIFDLEILISIFSILCCPSCLKNGLILEEDSRMGLSSNYNLHCKNCGFCKGFATSKKSGTNNEINSRFIFALRLIGKGFTAGKKLCATLNFPPFLSKLAFRLQEKKLLQATISVAQECMKSAAAEITDCSTLVKSFECGVSVDGTWQRRGYSSLNGIVSAISITSCKVLDMEIMSQFCRICNKWKKLSPSLRSSLKSHDCANHSGSSGNMEVVGVYRIFERSVQLNSLKYTNYYGDGDSKGYDAIKYIYGKDLPVSKLECIGHIQKRVGTHLRKLKSTIKGLGGKGKLTDNLINKLQNYYGIAIRSNSGNLLAMHSATIAVFAHCCADKHGQCPEGSSSWCKYQRNIALNRNYTSKTKKLPNKVLNSIRPTYIKLCDKDLLTKCLHGKTQNANESFNSVIWTLIPKNVFVEKQTLCFGAYLAVIQFNEGFCGLLKVFDSLKICPGYNTVKEYSKFDSERIVDSKRHSLPSAKLTRKKLRADRKKKSKTIEGQEGPMYKCGEF